MANRKDNIAAQETRRKLILAAAEVFAEKGLHAALIRDITARAGENIAAINYHFRDKFELYCVVLREVHCRAFEAVDALAPGGTPAERLRRFIGAYLRSLLDPERPWWQSRLIARELMEPTPALDVFIEEHVRHKAALLRTLVGELCPHADVEQVMLGSCSVIAQCMFFPYNRPITSRLFPQIYASDHLDMLIDHVTDFSLAGLAELERAAASRRVQAASRRRGRTRQR